MTTPDKTILLVEDEIFIAMAEEQMLRNNSYEVISVMNGEDAVSCVRNNPGINLVLMDIDLGKGIDGTEAARRILTEHTVPIVFLTSHSEREMVERVRGITRYGYVIKNSGEFVLLSSIEMAIELFGAHQNIENSIQNDIDHRNTEDRLGSSEPAVRALLDASPDTVLLIDIHGTTLALNSKAAERLHMSVDDVIGKNQFDLLPRDIAASRKKYLDTALQTGKTVNIADERDGMYLESTIYPIRDDDSGKITRVAIYSRDVTEIRTSHEHIRMLADLVDIAPASITVHDSEGNFIYANQKTLELHGYTREEFLKLHLQELDAPESAVLMKPRIQELIEKGELSFEVVHLRKDGTPIPMQVLNKLTTIAGKPAILSVGIDLTEKKRLENEFHELHSILKETQKISGTGGWVYDAGTGKMTWTDEVYEIYGVGDDFDPNNISADLSFYPPEWRTVIEEAFNDALHRGIPYDLEIELIRGNGEVIWVRTIGRPVMENGKIIRVQGNLVNIDQRKKNEEEIRRLLKEKELILRETHHRIKNNMGVIMSMLYLQATATENEQVTAALNDAHGRIQSMMLIYEKLYKSSDFSNISSREYLNDLIEGIGSTVPEIFNVTIKMNIEDHTLDSKILFPLGVIINELVTNSLKYAFPDNHEGEIDISFTLHSGTTFELKVGDNGVGFTVSDRKTTNSGFGLDVVNRLVAQIKGTITRDDTNGAIYRIVFPIPEDV
ncbi:MAG TPA: PAS domain S-box protein [Spirochaetota bacterium]|nr:PAS domain S-box protein [Spirochaetota bacterium]